MPRPRFTIGQTTHGEYCFELIAPSGDSLLTSELYTQRAHAVWGIGAVQRSARIDARYEKFIAKSGEYYFVLNDGNGEPLGTSVMYRSYEARESGIDSVKRSVLEAEIEG